MVVNARLVTSVADAFRLLAFIVVVFFLTRQVPLMHYSNVMNLFLVIFFLLSLNDILKRLVDNPELLLLYVVFLFASVFVLLSSYDNEVSLVVRFFIIVNLICLAYFCKPCELYVKLFLFFSLLQALLVIFFELFLFVNYSYSDYEIVRNFILNNEWGDVYSRGGMWKVQLRGNALLPFAFFVSMVYCNGIKRILLSSIFLLSVLFAGNLAFFIGIVFFLLLYFFVKKWTYYHLIGFSLFLVCGFLAFSLFFVDNLIEIFLIKSISSNPTRADQIIVLWNDMLNSVYSFFFGSGFGNTINVETEWRDYSGNTYFEVQIFYFLNQMGVVPFLVFVFFNVFASACFFQYPLVVATYFSYILYASINPYLLDTNHIVVILVLLAIAKVKENEYLRRDSYLSA